MSYDPSFDAFMAEPVTWERYTGLDGYGKKTYDAPKPVLGRIEQGARLVRDTEGREVASQTRLFLRPTTEDGSAYSPGVNDRFTLPGYIPPQPPVLSVARVNDEAGLHHYEVAL